MLSVTDRDFFRLLSDAVFANPFSEDRERIDRRPAGPARGDGPQEILERLLARVRDRLRSLPPKALRLYPEGDRPLVEQAILFDLFHRVADSFDALIQQQLAMGADTAPVAFGGETLSALARAGFGAKIGR